MKPFYEETAKRRIAKVLFKQPEKEFSLSELAREAKVAKANIGNILRELEDGKVIIIEKLSKIWRIRANQTSTPYLRKKKVYNLEFIYNSEIIDFLADYFKNPKAIILFGSFRSGEDISTSDIDIAVESEESKILRIKELKKFESIINRTIQIHLFDRNSVDANVFNNIANGIVLWGFLAVKK